MRRLVAPLAAVSALALVLGGCDDEPAPGQPAPGSVELRVMTFNVWYGGVSVDFGQVAEAIRAADADIVGVQEPEGNLARIAEAAGLPYVDESMHVISRYPLFTVERDGVRFAYAEVARNRVVAVENVHLTCCPYGPNLVQAGKPAADVLALEERVRLPEAEEYVDALEPLIDDDVPVFITGDFNTPSHLDWTAEAIEARDLPYELEWPASRAFADRGFRDSYRQANPDPAATPGLTWTAGQPPPRLRPSETHDRIDWVLAGGPAETVSSEIVGEEGGPDVGVGVSPWGSDHRGVVSEFTVEPAPAPYLVQATPQRVALGDRVTLRFSLAGGGPGRTVGYVAGPDPRARPDATIPIYDASDHIAPMLGTVGATTGRQTAVLLDSAGEPLASAPFWIVARGAEPAISASRPRYAPGEPIQVSWRDGPGSKLDYVAIFRASDPSVYGYYGYIYAGGRVNGSVRFTRADLGRLPPGEYIARLMLDDGYAAVAESKPFTVAR